MRNETRGLGMRGAVAAVLMMMIAMPEAPAYAQRRGGGGGYRGGGGGSRGSVRSVNRNPSGNGGSWSGARSSGTTSRSTYGDSSSRSTTAKTRSGETVQGNRTVSTSGDEINVNRNVQSTSGASKSSQKTYDMGDGRVESVERNTQVTGRNGQTANWEGKAEREGYGWEFEGEGKNRYGQKVEADGYGARGAYGRGVVADVEGGRYGDRTVVAGKGYGGPVYARQLPAGANRYNYYGRSYYGYGGAYYRPYPYHGGYYYGYMPPPWGVCYSYVPVGAIALTVAGAALLYSDGTYYQTTYVEGATQYQVVAPPEGAALPAGTALPADRTSLTIAGVTYYIYGNTFYKKVVTDGKDSYVVITKPPGVVQVNALPSDAEPMQGGSIMYFRSKARYYLPFLDPNGSEYYIVVDTPAGAVPAVPADQPPGAAASGAAPAKSAAAAPKAAAVPKAAAPAPAAAKPTVISMTAPTGTPVTVRFSSEINSGKTQAGQRFQGNLNNDLVTGGRVVATRGTRVYGRVVEASSGTGLGKDPSLTLELTDMEVGENILPLKTEPQKFTGEGKKPGKKIIGAAALGAGIGGIIDEGEGAGKGAAIGAGVGLVSAAGSPGNQIAVAPGTPIEFRLAQPLLVNVVG